MPTGPQAALSVPEDWNSAWPESDSVTFVASEGPLLCTTNVYVIGTPATGTRVDAVLVTETSADRSTLTFALALLLPGFESPLALDTVARSAYAPGVCSEGIATLT